MSEPKAPPVSLLDEEDLQTATVHELRFKACEDLESIRKQVKEQRRQLENMMQAGKLSYELMADIDDRLRAIERPRRPLWPWFVLGVLIGLGELLSRVDPSSPRVRPGAARRAP